MAAPVAMVVAPGIAVALVIPKSHAPKAGPPMNHAKKRLLLVVDDCRIESEHGPFWVGSGALCGWEEREVQRSKQVGDGKTRE